MKKTYNITHLNGNMYMVDDGDIKQGEWVFNENQIMRASVNHTRPLVLKRILASTDSSLGLSLLPKLGDNVEQLAFDAVKKGNLTEDRDIQIAVTGWVDGYETAPKKKYSEDDLQRAMELAWDGSTRFNEAYYQFNEDLFSKEEWYQVFKTQKILQSQVLNKTDYIKKIMKSFAPRPIGAKVKMILDLTWDNDSSMYSSDPGNYIIKTTNNIVNVIKYIYA